MNWNVNGEKRKECNSFKAWREMQRVLGLCRNPSQTLTDLVRGK